MDTDRSHSWSRYWASGALHSCVGSFADNYDGQIAAFWADVFTRLPAAARVLDIATGNGALPRLLLESGLAPSAKIDAVDLAEVAPRWTRDLAPEQARRVSFHSGIRAEALPFADASFDLIASQFGIEYTDLAASAAEVRRVLRAHGSIALLLHHSDSLPVRLGRVELDQLNWLGRSDGLLDRARILLPYLSELGTPAGLARVRTDERAQQARGAVNQAMRELDDRAALDPDAASVLGEVQSSLAAMFNAAPQLGSFHAQARLNAWALGLAQARLRQRELVDCALDESGLRLLADTLSAGRNFRREVCQIFVRDQLFGWGLRLQAVGTGEDGG